MFPFSVHGISTILYVSHCQCFHKYVKSTHGPSSSARKVESHCIKSAARWILVAPSLGLHGCPAIVAARFVGSEHWNLVVCERSREMRVKVICHILHLVIRPGSHVKVVEL